MGRAGNTVQEVHDMFLQERPTESSVEGSVAIVATPTGTSLVFSVIRFVVWVAYLSLRVAVQQSKGEGVRSLPPTRLSPTPHSDGLPGYTPPPRLPWDC